jgi:S-methylmethionine-dependent homocysteine/selenocysteine methylase
VEAADAQQASAMAAARAGVIILDGGMGRQLSRMGAPFRLPEWSALALIEAPGFVRAAHDAFIASGAQVITTNSYGIVPHMIGAARFASEGRALAGLAGRLARAAADHANSHATGHVAGPAGAVLVAGSLPPLFASYRPELFQPGQAAQILEVLVAALAPHVDFWLAETQSSTAETTAAFAATRHSGLPLWVSYTLRDELGRAAPPELRSGEAVGDAVARDLQQGAQAILFNCSQPEVMNAAVQAAARVVAHGNHPDVRIGVYANAFTPEPSSAEPYAGISTFRDDLGPQSYREWAELWVGSGATIIGGCCGIGPEHIAALRAHFHG